LQPRRPGWLRRLRYLTSQQPPKPKKRTVPKLGIATAHFISLTNITSSAGVTFNKNVGLSQQFFQFSVWAFKSSSYSIRLLVDL
jgi:hypothetical protein